MAIATALLGGEVREEIMEKEKDSDKMAEVQEEKEKGVGSPVAKTVEVKEEVKVPAEQKGETGIKEPARESTVKKEKPTANIPKQQVLWVPFAHLLPYLFAAFQHATRFNLSGEDDQGSVFSSKSIGHSFQSSPAASTTRVEALPAAGTKSIRPQPKMNSVVGLSAWWPGFRDQRASAQRGRSFVFFLGGGQERFFFPWKRFLAKSLTSLQTSKTRLPSTSPVKTIKVRVNLPSIFTLGICLIFIPFLSFVTNVSIYFCNFLVGVERSFSRILRPPLPVPGWRQKGQRLPWPRQPTPNPMSLATPVR